MATEGIIKITSWLLGSPRFLLDAPKFLQQLIPADPPFVSSL
jgi:hypothetical protein